MKAILKVFLAIILALCISLAAIVNYKALMADEVDTEINVLHDAVDIHINSKN